MNTYASSIDSTNTACTHFPCGSHFGPTWGSPAKLCLATVPLMAFPVGLPPCPVCTWACQELYPPHQFACPVTTWVVTSHTHQVWQNLCRHTHHSVQGCCNSTYHHTAPCRLRTTWGASRVVGATGRAVMTPCTQQVCLSQGGFVWEGPPVLWVSMDWHVGHHGELCWGGRGLRCWSLRAHFWAPTKLKTKGQEGATAKLTTKGPH